MTWAWPDPITFDEKFPSGPNGSAYGATEFDLTQWVNGYFIEGYNGDLSNLAWSSELGKLYPDVPGYGTISHSKGYLFDEDWFELGTDIPAGHYSISVEDFNWDLEEVSNGSFDHFAVVTDFHSPPLFVSDTPGTTSFIYDGTASGPLFVYVAGETVNKSQYKIKK